MGAWTLEAYKLNDTGGEMLLTDEDFEEIAEAIIEGYTSGQIKDGDN